MAYQGTTSTAPNVPQLVTQGIAFSSSNVTGTVGIQRGGPRTWVYTSTHISSDIEAVNFFTDGKALGFQVGDLLIHTGSTTFVITSHTVVAVGATTTDLGVGSTLGLGS
jgi:hypothetical protein